MACDSVECLAFYRSLLQNIVSLRGLHCMEEHAPWRPCALLYKITVHQVTKVHDLPWNDMVHVIPWDTMHTWRVRAWNNMLSRRVIPCSNMHSWHVIPYEKMHLGACCKGTCYPMEEHAQLARYSMEEHTPQCVLPRCMISHEIACQLLYKVARTVYTRLTDSCEKYESNMSHELICHMTHVRWD